MRLTLRTLLAYLDDILEPAQAKELGEKINESGFAAGLVSRIRDVMRRRRLTAPALSGPGTGVDPNTVAEYLDNTLSPEAVADVEKICLDSDVHLAEVAACHQVLTLVLGEPVEVTPESRERMYALGPLTPETSAAELDAAAGLDPHRIPSSGLSAASVGTVAAPSTNGEPHDGERRVEVAGPASMTTKESFAGSLPEYLRPHTAWNRILPYTVLAILAGFWLVSIFTDSPLRIKAPSRPGAEGEGPAPAVVATDTAPAPAPDVATVGQKPVPSLPQTPRDMIPEPPGEPQRPLADVASNAPRRTAIDAPPPPDEPESVLPGKATKPASVPPAVAATKVPMPVDPDVPVPAVPKAQPAKYVSPEGVVLQYSPKDEKWFVLPHVAFIHPGELLAVPEPFEARIEIDGGRGALVVPGGSLLRTLGANPVAASGWDLRRGRLVVRPTASADENQKPALTMALQIRGDLWGLELQTADTVCGIEVVLAEPNQFEQALGRQAYHGAIYVSSGSVRLVGANQLEHTIAGPGWLPLPLSALVADQVADAPPLLALPRWLGQQPLSAVAKQYSKLFEKDFSPTEPVELSIVSTVQDHRPVMSQLAVECLGLINACEPLIDALKRASGHDEARKAAVYALRTWLPLAPQNREKLKAELSKRFTPVDADTVYRLLWGFNEDDARNPIISRQLVDWMDHDEVAIRELAFHHVQRLTKKDFNYRPNVPPAERQMAVYRWRQHIRNGALLPK